MTTEGPVNEKQSGSMPILRRTHAISIIWTLPLIALAICGWLLYQGIHNAGIEITIYFHNAQGIVAGKTQVIANGIPVGTVTQLAPDMEHNRVRASVTMEKALEPYLVSDALFWIVRPELSAAKVEGLDTLLTGSYIGFRAGTSQQPQREFTGLPSPPPVAKEAPGLHVTLRAETLGSIQEATGVYYKNIEIGSVQEYHLDKNNSILIDLFIKPKFTALVREKSRFCNASGLTISGKLPNLKAHFESFASLLKGGIEVFTPVQLLDSPPATNGQIFRLYKDYEEASYGIPMTLQLASGADITEGVTKILYRGVEAGYVKNIQINDDPNRTVTAHILLDPRAALILRHNTVFWLVKPTISAAGVKNLRTLITGPYITFRPGDGTFRDRFTILPEPPPQIPLRPGTPVHLVSSGGVDLKAGAPVYYKQIQVGEVSDIGLESRDGTVHITVFIYTPYEQLLGADSVFWLQSGVKMTADASGLKMRTGPLTRLLYGGIDFLTPSRSGTKPAPASRQSYPLYQNFDEAVAATPALQPKGLHFQLRSQSPGNLQIGAPILYSDIQIGHIAGFQFAKDNRSVLIDCFIELKYKAFVTTTSRFYIVSGLKISGSLNGFELKMGSLESVFKGGIACISRNGGHPWQPREPLPLYNSLNEALHAADSLITVRFTRVDNLKIGAGVRYKGVEVGAITDISYDAPAQDVLVRFRIDNRLASLFRTTTRIWQVQPKIALTGVQNAETAIFGTYLTFLPGSGKPTRDFIGLTEPPQNPFSERKGLPLILETSHLGSLEVGSPLYYRQLEVGEVTGFDLSPSFRNVYVYVLVAPKYAPIVRRNSRFWNLSGAQVNGSLFSGLSVTVGSIHSLIKGGIGLATPDDEKQAGPAASAKDHYVLYDKVQKEWLDWNPDIVLLGR